MDQKTVEIYHERQVKEFCALHALNNLFQDKNAFSKTDLDNICESLSPGSFVNPHRSFFGFGNYDVNVIMAAVQMKEFELIWFDKRRDIRCLIPDNIFGFILNTPTVYKLGFLQLPFSRKHWKGYRKIGNAYYNLDSKLDYPECIGEENLLLAYFHDELEDGNKELLIVVTKDIASSGSWNNGFDNCPKNSQDDTIVNKNAVLK